MKGTILLQTNLADKVVIRFPSPAGENLADRMTIVAKGQFWMGFSFDVLRKLGPGMHDIELPDQGQ